MEVILTKFRNSGILITYLKYQILNKTTHDTQIELAIADLKQQMKPNIAATARKYAVNESTLKKRWNKKNYVSEQASSEYKQRLTSTQGEVLVAQIKLLTDRGLPPTSSIVRNLAEEILENRVGKNWTGDFCSAT